VDPVAEALQGNDIGYEIEQPFRAESGHSRTDVPNIGTQVTKIAPCALPYRWGPLEQIHARPLIC
jgi:hypothetical protein